MSKASIRTLLAVRAVPDTLSQGGDRDRSPWPRRVAAAVVLVVAAVLIVLHLPGARHSPPAPNQSGSATPTAAPSGTGAPAVATGPDGITGPVLSWPGGLRLPATGQQPAWFSPGTGKMAPIGGLPPRPSGYQFIPVADGWAIQADPGVQAPCDTCAGPPRAVYFLAEHAESVTRVGLADAVAPAAGGGLWLTSYPADADPLTATGTVREVSVAGAPLGPRFALPAGEVILRATDRGLLLAPTALQSSATAYRLWDPAAPQAQRTLGWVLAASARAIASAPPCAARCQVQVLNLDTGQRFTIELPAGRSAVSAAFSPDGRSLAVEESFSDEGDDGGQAVQLELVSTASGRVTAVPGTWLSSDALISFGWPSGSDSLVAELGFTTKVQLLSWRPGAARVSTALLTPRQRDSGSLVIGQYGP
jgi:hypothetical protein